MIDPSRIRLTGPLATHREGFWAELRAQGYTPLSSANQLRLMAHLSRWLEASGLDPAELSEKRIEEFLEHRRAAGYTAWLSRRGLAPILSHLRRVDVVPAAEEPENGPTPSDRLLQRYERYLLHERGLVHTTVQGYLTVARRFLSDQGGGILEVRDLTPADVTGFVVRESLRWSIGGTKSRVTGLRSLLRYLYVEGELDVDLAPAVPSVAGYRLSGLPRGLDPEQVERLLGGVDCDTVIGRRDYTALLLMVRLGLRAVEVARLELGDVHWAQGEITVRGKGNRRERLPLPDDVGEALADYLGDRRPGSPCRYLLLRERAPRHGLSSAAVSMIVSRAGKKVGLGGLGAHCLRHTAATRMLGQGASLPEVAQVLRHRSLDTTAIYAKVDREALRPLCRRWPGRPS